MSALLSRIRLAGGRVSRGEDGAVRIAWPPGADEALQEEAARSRPLVGALLDVEGSFLPDAGHCAALAEMLALCARRRGPETDALAAAVRAACRTWADFDLAELRRLGTAAARALQGLLEGVEPAVEGEPLLAALRGELGELVAESDLDRYYGVSPVRAPDPRRAGRALAPGDVRPDAPRQRPMGRVHEDPAIPGILVATSHGRPA